MQDKLISNDSFFFSTTNSSTTATGKLNLASIKKMVCELNEKFPPSKTVVKVVLGSNQYYLLKHGIHNNHTVTRMPMDKICGIPIELDSDAPPDWQAIHYADGSVEICGVKHPPIKPRKESHGSL